MEYLSDAFDTGDEDVDTFVDTLYTAAFSTEDADVSDPVESLRRGGRLGEIRPDRHYDTDQTHSGYETDIDTDSVYITLKSPQDTDAVNYVIPGLERDGDGDVRRMAVIGPDGMYVLEREETGNGFKYRSHRRETSDEQGSLDQHSRGFKDRADLLFRIADHWNQIEKDDIREIPEIEPDIEKTADDSPREAFRTFLDREKYRAGEEDYTVVCDHNYVMNFFKKYKKSNMEESLGKALQEMSQDPSEYQQKRGTKGALPGFDNDANVVITVDEEDREVHIIGSGKHKNDNVSRT
jgi:hypothetical protein